MHHKIKPVNFFKNKYFCNIFTNFLTQRTAIISVINDLATDQRVQRTCHVLREKGFSVTLIGRKLRGSLEVDHLPFHCIRMRMLFRSGPLFYLFFNIRLFFLLLTKNADVLIANDLDTLLPNYLVSKWKGIKLIYDSHEIFTEVPELQNEKFKKKVWETIERWIVPKLKYCITVNKSIADFFYAKYGTRFHVIRNIPDQQFTTEKIKSRKELNLPEEKKIIILQGSGINVERGAEELVSGMQFLSDEYLLLIIGGGDVISKLKKMSAHFNLSNKIFFMDKLSPKQLFHYTSNSDLGVTLDKDTNLNYRFSLPNKIFDYINAGVPVLASTLPEIENLILKFNIGAFIYNHQPEHIASKIKETITSTEYRIWKDNTNEAKKINNWSNEKKEWDKII